MTKKAKTEKVINILFLALMIIGLTFTLIYIFYTSTMILTSDSVITDVLAHYQRLNHQLLLSNWYYGNELWLFSLSIPTFILSFFINNNILLRQVSVLITAILFFLIMYIYGKNFVKKKENMIIIIIFLTGISYSVLDYFYAFNAYLTVTINSMFLLYLYFKSINQESSKLYYIMALIVSFLLNMGSLRYLPSVTGAFILSEIILIAIKNKNSSLKTIIKKEYKKIEKILGIIFASILGVITFTIIINLLHYEQRAGSLFASDIDGRLLVKSIKAVIECINNFFGFDNRNHSIIPEYFVPNHRNYNFISILSFTNIIKIIICIYFIIICPIVLFKNYRKNSNNINFLLVFNTVSWLIMIYLYIFTYYFFHDYSELKYYIFNIVLNIILGIYCLYKYFGTNKKKTIIIDIIILLYISSNLYTTYLTLKDNNKNAMKDKYELVNILKKNNLTFGYAGFWNGLITHYLSDYEITVASVNFYDKISRYNWYADESWFKTKHPGKIFVVFDKTALKQFSEYKNNYQKPDKIIKCNKLTVYIYNQNPFLEI